MWMWRTLRAGSGDLTVEGGGGCGGCWGQGTVEGGGGCGGCWGQGTVAVDVDVKDAEGRVRGLDCRGWRWMWRVLGAGDCRGWRWMWRVLGAGDCSGGCGCEGR